MKKLVLIDGNNLMFRSYYATAYSNNLMKNSKNFPTNALYGFVQMINKIINEENPEYMAVCFDIGKNFRKKEYSFYKEGRQTTPDELKEQMPVARKILDAMGIKYLEMEPYEADDIIGTISQLTENDKDFASVIISSDKDLLQLISDETEMKLLKQTGFIRYNHESFLNDYKIEPIRIIDLKALMGDSSDNIPGVKGIGEKTALKLLQEYGSLENIYDNINNITGKTKEKLENDKEMAFISKKIATIYRDVPLNISLLDLEYKKVDQKALIEIYKELEFHSFLKNINIKNEEKPKFQLVDDISLINLDDTIAIDVMLSEENYHKANLIGLSITDSKNTYIFRTDFLHVINAIKNKDIITYDAKKIIGNTKIKINVLDDLMIMAYLLNYNIKDDLSSLSKIFNTEIKDYESIKKSGFVNEEVNESLAKRSQFIYKIKNEMEESLKKTNASKLYKEIELPLLYVLADMEITGIVCKKETLDKMAEDIMAKIDIVTNDIYNLAGCEFNISSPKQLGEILFSKLQLSKGKKNKTGFKTDAKVMEKLIDKHPIVGKILLYRNLTKLKSTYIDGLKNYILSDGKIHTIFKQTLTRTGRLSSTEPNLQNIPVREELGRKIRMAFVPENDYLISADYSQIELRIMAHLANCGGLIEAFKNGEDIHTHVASLVFKVSDEEVTKEMRRCAKAVVFGIIYGISGFGLGENLHIKKSEAEDYINRFYILYPEIKKYTDGLINEAKETMAVETLFGRKRVIEEIKSPSYMIRQMGERMAMNTPIQGTSADIMKLAMIKVYNRLQKENLKSKMILQVHDEIIIDLKKEELNSVSKILKEEMENVYNLSVPLKVEIDYGENWYLAK